MRGSRFRASVKLEVRIQSVFWSARDGPRGLGSGEVVVRRRRRRGVSMQRRREGFHHRPDLFSLTDRLGLVVPVVVVEMSFWSTENLEDGPGSDNILDVSHWRSTFQLASFSLGVQDDRHDSAQEDEDPETDKDDVDDLGVPESLLVVLDEPLQDAPVVVSAPDSGRRDRLDQSGYRIVRDGEDRVGDGREGEVSIVVDPPERLFERYNLGPYHAVEKRRDWRFEDGVSKRDIDGLRDQSVELDQSRATRKVESVNGPGQDQESGRTHLSTTVVVFTQSPKRSSSSIFCVSAICRFTSVAHF